MKIIESVKEHPYIAGVGVFVLGVILIVIVFSGGKAPAQVTQTAQSDTQGATQLAMAQIQAQAATTVSANQLAASNTASAASVSIAQLQAATQQNADTMGANAQITIAKTNADALVGQSTIQANMLQHASDNALQATINTNAAALATTTSNNAAAIAIAANNNDVTMHGQDQAYNLGVQQAQIAGQVSMANNDRDDYTRRVLSYNQYGISGN